MCGILNVITCCMIVVSIGFIGHIDDGVLHFDFDPPKRKNAQGSRLAPHQCLDTQKTKEKKKIYMVLVTTISSIPIFATVKVSNH